MQLLSTILLLTTPIVSAFAPSTTIIARNPSSSNSILFSVADVKTEFKLSPNKTYLLDVREPAEWAEGHLALASPNPLSELTKGTWMNSATGVFSPGSFPIDRKTGVAIMTNRKIYIHCKMGGRAKQAAELLTQMGYKDVTALEETFDQLEAAEICEVVRGEVQDLTD
mmetsp:Transcript_22764/g.33723  ORF Transcript_22764/g.33723 Transcript_22764/m.33723 type:complete len:168 (-) Transcript_22764:161-664(-)